MFISIRHFIAFLLLSVTFLLSSCAVPDNFETSVKTQGAIERIYLARGKYAVGYFESATKEAKCGKFEVYYPTNAPGMRFPVIVIANGTGVKASAYSVVLKHYASWGFIIIGNEQENSWSGDGAEASLCYILKSNNLRSSSLYNKVDTRHIGIVGHSQGGVAVFNAVTKQPHASSYTACVALSPTAEQLAANLKWPYDPTKVSIPTLIFTGTEGFETKTVIPFADLQKLYNKMRCPKVMARRKGDDHGPMLYSACGYVTAWFRWQLQGDTYAAKAFTGSNPELKANTLYQDQKFNLS